MTPINFQRPCGHPPGSFKRRATERLAALRGTGPGKVQDLNAIWDTQVLKCDVNGSGPYEKDMGLLGKPSGHLWVRAVLALTKNGTAILTGTIIAKGDWEGKAEAETLRRLETLMDELVSN